MTDNETKVTAVAWTPVRERLLLLTLAAIQFTTVLDFIIIMPLGPQYVKVFHITNWQYQMIVGAYGFSAGLAGLVAGFFLDRFDRKQALVWLYVGFAAGTLFCATANTYHLLVIARLVAGVFGGLCGPVILSIVGDVVPMARRGAAMGIVMSSFSVASIVGVPIGIYVAHYSSWHVPFYAIAALSGIIVIVVAIITPPLRGHMIHAADEHPVARTWAVMTHPDHQKSYIFMAMLTFTGFCIFVVIPTFLVKNVGFTEEQLLWMYFFGGSCTVFSMNLVGRWSDRSGKLKVFAITSLSCAVPILLVTNLPRVAQALSTVLPSLVVVGLPRLALALVCSTLLMICMSSRMVPAMAMMTAAVEARDRGGFMSINSAVQQFSMFLAALATGAILGEGPDGKLTHFPVAGLISIVCAYTCIYLARYLKVPAKSEAPGEPVLVEM